MTDDPTAVAKKVRFSEGLSSTHYIDPIPDDCKRNVYYSPAKLKLIQEHENRKVDYYQQCYGKTACFSIESDQLSWRGLEALQEGDDRELRMYIHLHSVLQELQATRDPEAIRTMARLQSQPDCQCALDRAAKDAQVVREINTMDAALCASSKHGKSKTLFGKLKRVIRPRKIAAVDKK
jgi:hypothetical protein